MEDVQLQVSAVNQVFGMLYALIGVIGIICNLLTFRTMWKERRKSYFHLQLAVTNIVSLSSIAMAGPSALRGRWLFGSTMCEWFGLQTFTTGYAEVVFTCLICIECYTALCRKSDYKKLSDTMFAGISVGVWIISFAFALAPILGWNTYLQERGSTSCGINLWNSENANHYSYLTMTSILFHVVFVVAIGCLVLTIISRSNNESFTFDPLLKDNELLKISGALLLISALGCFPYYIRTIWYLHKYEPVFNSFLGIEFSHILMKLGNCLQPVAYLIFSGQFKTLSQSMITGVSPEKKNN